MTSNRIIAQAKNEARALLTEVESKELLGKAGISIIATRLAATREEAIAISRQLGFPTVLKIASPDIVHKNDAGGVRLGLETAEQVGTAYDRIMAAARQAYPRARLQGVSVQRMAPPGLEVIIGMSQDAQFGPVVMFGLGGIWVEILKDVSFRIVPLTKTDATEMIREIKGYPLLAGYRNQPAVALDRLEEMILKIADFADANPDVIEIDLNPVLAYNDDAIAVDARVILAKTEKRPE